MAPVFAVIGLIGTAITTVTSVVAGAIGAVTMAVAGVNAGIAAYTALSAILPAVAGYLAVSEVASLLSPSPHGSNTNSVAFKADTQAGVPYVIGRTGIGGNIVFMDTSNDGHNKWLHYIVALSVGPVNAVEGFTANNVPLTFNNSTGSLTNIGWNWKGVYSNSTAYAVNDGVSYLGNLYICLRANTGYAPNNPDYWAQSGNYVGPGWNGKMWQLTTVGTQPDTVLSAPSGTGTVPEWTSVNELSGIAHARWVLQADQSAYPGGTPQPLWIVRGPAVYDPRKDSTWPGGSGTQRWNDQTTWAYSENPFLHALTWLIGQKSNGKRIMGLGAPISAIDVNAFINGANVADANGWKVGGQVFSTDSKWDVLVQMLQAGGGAPIRIGATISCIVQTPRVALATLTGADFTGPVSIQAMVARKDRINRVVPTIRSPMHQWAMTALDPISVAAYQTVDGGQRTKGINMPLVQWNTQAGQLARYAIEDSREFGPITAQLKPQWSGLQPGDAVVIDEPELGLSQQLCMVIDRKLDPASGLPSFTLRSETTAKHAAALGATANPPPPPSLTIRSSVAAAPTGWTATGTTVTNGGLTIPAILVSGTMENPAASLSIRTRLSAGPGPWESYDIVPAATAGRTVITGVASGEIRDVELSYIVAGNQGATTVISSVTAGTAAADFSTVTGTTKPANNATNNQTYVQTSDPALSGSVPDGALWSNPSNGKLFLRVSGSWQLIATASTPMSDGDVIFDSTVSGAFSVTIPANALNYIDIFIYGGGGGARLTHGGGGGGYVFKDAYAVTPGTTVISGVIGAAGTGYDPGGTGAATSGGDTTVTTPALTAHGGGAATSSAGGAGGTATGGTVNTTGEAGDTGAVGNGGACLGSGNGGPSGGARQTTGGANGNSPGGGSPQQSGFLPIGGAGRVVILTKSS
jgi:hypothetical protein